MKQIFTNTFFIILCLAYFLEDSSLADTVCLRAQLQSGKVRLAKRIVATSTCPRGYLSLVDTTTLTGPQGAPGATGSTGPQGAVGPTGAAGSAGADGSLRIYGDGSAGALNVTSSGSLTGNNYQFTDISIAAGVNFSIPSGTVLRCTGTLTLNGALVVSNSGAYGSNETSSTAATGTPALRVPAYGVALGPAGAGEYGTNATGLFGGGPAPGLSAEQALSVRYPLPASCGSGAGGAVTGASGGSSGGAIVVLCKNNILINSTGSLLATGENGTNGSGGGSGGVVILASKTNITNSGTISVNGGAGGNSVSRGGAGGGGGGGIIHLLAPTVFATGSMTRAGGAAGLTTVAVTSSPRFGGGAGGSCGGQGGFGADVAAGNTQSGVANGQNGHLLITNADPTSLF